MFSHKKKNEGGIDFYISLERALMSLDPNDFAISLSGARVKQTYKLSSEPRGSNLTYIYTYIYISSI